MKLIFLGTRGEIEARSRRHRMHSSLLLTNGIHRITIDCGQDWIGRVQRMKPDAIILTHAHSDHAGGLRNGSPCPVFATAETWEALKRYPIADRRLIVAHKRFQIAPFALEAAPVQHSLRAPAVGLRVKHHGGCVFYVPDVAFIPMLSRVLAGVAVYVGDGASLVRPILRKRSGVVIGHASIAAQLDWCRAEEVRRAIFTHCGSPIVAAGDRNATPKLRELGRRRGIEVALAHDGLQLSI